MILKRKNREVNINEEKRTTYLSKRINCNNMILVSRTNFEEKYQRRKRINHLSDITKEKKSEKCQSITSSPYKKSHPRWKYKPLDNLCKLQHQLTQRKMNWLEPSGEYSNIDTEHLWRHVNGIRDKALEPISKHHFSLFGEASKEVSTYWTDAVIIVH